MSELGEIQVLSWVEAVRRRPAMYFGDVHDGTGLLHLMWSAFGIAMDQFIAGDASAIHVSVDADGTVEIVDDGEGIPATARAGQTLTILECAATSWRTSRVLGGEIPFVVGGWNCGGTYGLVSAVSSFFEIESTYAGERMRIRCVRGEVIDRTHLGLSSVRGTRVCFRPDETIFEGRITPALVADLITETSWLHPRLCLVWQGERLANGGGIEAWTRLRASSELADDFVFATRMQDGESVVDVALGWRVHAGECAAVRGFVNSQPKPSDALIPGVREGVRRVAQHYGFDADPEWMVSGAVGAVHVTMRDDHLPSDALVARAIADALPVSLDAHHAAKKRFIARAAKSASAL